MLPSVDYLGHMITSERLQPMNEKVHAILEALDPQNASQLHSSLGVVKYYNKFFSPSLQYISTTLQLLEK